MGRDDHPGVYSDACAVQRIWVAHRDRVVTARTALSNQILGLVDQAFPALSGCYRSSLLAARSARVIIAAICDPDRIRRLGVARLRTLVGNRGVAMTTPKATEVVAAGLSRAPSTVSREVAANGGRAGYRATVADAAAQVRRRRPKTCKLAASPRLQALVAAKLAKRWAPEQIAGWLRRTHPNDPELQLSHETIYRTLFIQSRGALKRELTDHLRTGRKVRQPGNRNRARGQGRGQLVDIVHISQRPAEVADRAIPGHWEGDLILGSNTSAIATLVERSTRYVTLVGVDGIKSVQVVPALRDHIVTLPAQLARSITWDQGKEMALHAQFTIDTGIQIYFCDPKSPWQRGSNENTNGLLRQYFPRRTNLARHTQTDLDAVTAQLNGRPRKTLDFMTPSEKFTEAVATTR